MTAWSKFTEKLFSSLKHVLSALSLEIYMILFKTGNDSRNVSIDSKPNRSIHGIVNDVEKVGALFHYRLCFWGAVQEARKQLNILDNLSEGVECAHFRLLDKRLDIKFGFNLNCSQIFALSNSTTDKSNPEFQPILLIIACFNHV